MKNHKFLRYVAALLVACSAGASFAKADDCKILDEARLKQLQAANEVTVQRAFLNHLNEKIALIQSTDSDWNQGLELGAGVGGMLITYWMASEGQFGKQAERGYALVGKLLKKNPVFGLMFGVSASVAVKGGYDLYLRTENIDRIRQEISRQNVELAKLEATRLEKALQFEMAQGRLPKCVQTVNPPAISADSVKVEVTKKVQAKS